MIKEIWRSLWILGLIIFLKIIMVIFEIVKLPSLANETNIEAFKILDYIGELIVHPGFIVLFSTIIPMLILIGLRAADDPNIKRIYSKQLTLLCTFWFVLLSAPFLGDFLR
ncbi:hypothetical protein [Paenibacillus agilis]|uniref:Uncharacterized protein n=1 Tax=Paenibacillus agilis TaxID=3020863 RepID=A0A559ID47_9BACL|nr:hypothetical protein [Paenibacillus agilis]TVX85598.1 hypothetical protein FPZ44_24905 [Paenibacillus agilis]